MEMACWRNTQQVNGLSMNDDNLLYRQIHPSWITEGEVGSLAFRPSKKDEGKLSVHDGEQVEAIDSWSHYTRVENFESVGVMAVTVGECKSLGLSVNPAPKLLTPFHCEIDFTEFSGNQRKIKSQQLADFAKKRGWQYRSEVLA